MCKDNKTKFVPKNKIKSLILHRGVQKNESIKYKMGMVKLDRGMHADFAHPVMSLVQCCINK